MNAIVKFRLCTLTTDELLKKVDRLTDEMYKTGRIPERQIPARPNEDYDLLIGELIIRLDLLQKKVDQWIEINS